MDNISEAIIKSLKNTMEKNKKLDLNQADIIIGNVKKLALKCVDLTQQKICSDNSIESLQRITQKATELNILINKLGQQVYALAEEHSRSMQDEIEQIQSRLNGATKTNPSYWETDEGIERRKYVQTNLHEGQ